MPDAGRGAAEWIAAGYRRQQGTAGAAPRPTTFEFTAALRRVREALAERGLARARIGADWDFLPVADQHGLLAALPEPAWRDGSDVLRRLRAVKAPGEMERARTGCALAEAGLRRMAGAIADGVSREHLTVAWRAGVAAAVGARGVTGLTGTWDFIAVGSRPSGAERLRSGRAR